MNSLFNRYFFLLLVTVLFVPKVSLFTLPGFAVTVKPEDVLWLCILPLFLLRRPDLRTKVNLGWLLILLYLLVSCLWSPSNFLLAARLFFYSIPLMYGLHLTAGQVDGSCKIIRNFLFVFAIIAVLQVTMPFPGISSGEWYFDRAGRAPGIFTNGVEFALVAYFAFWLSYLLGERSFSLWVAALAISVLAGTRFVSLVLLFCGLVYVRKLPSLRQVLFGGAAGLAAVAFFMAFILDSPSYRWEGVNPSGILGDAVNLVSSLTASPYVNPVEGYCFKFDNSLASDESWSMRLSKLKFVMETVVLGENQLGFGLGKCLGDAGDNLYVRMLSDGGLFFMLAALVFFAMLMLLPFRDRALRRDWRIFFASFLLVSFFYDTLYFSRAAPLAFAIFAVLLGRFRMQRCKSAVAEDVVLPVPEFPSSRQS